MNEVEVTAIYHADGSVTPKSIVLDGMSYPINKVLRIIPVSTTKAGGAGLRYEVLLDGRRNVLLLETPASYTSIRKWFMD